MSRVRSLEESNAKILMEKRIVDIPFLGKNSYERFFEEIDDFYSLMDASLDSDIESYGGISLKRSGSDIKCCRDLDEFCNLLKEGYSPFSGGATVLWDYGEASLNSDIGGFLSSDVYSVAVKGSLSNEEFSSISRKLNENNYFHR